MSLDATDAAQLDPSAAVGGPAYAVAGLVLLIGSLALAPIATVLARRISPGRNVFFARWGFSAVGMVSLVGLGVAMLVSSLLSEVGDLGLPGPLVGIVASTWTFLSIAVFIVVLARRLDPIGWRCLGLRAGGHLRGALVAILGYLAGLPGILGLTLAWPSLMPYLGLDFQPQSVVDDAKALIGSPAALAVFALLAVGVMPFLEELVFRGFLQPLLVQNLGDRGGLVVTSGIFALMHGASASIPIFGLSLVIGSVMLRTQRLSAAWLVHALHNGLMLSLLFLVPGAREMLGQEAPGSGDAPAIESTENP